MLNANLIDTHIYAVVLTDCFLMIWND